MIGKKSNKIKSNIECLFVLTGIVLVIYFSPVAGDNNESIPKDPNTASHIRAQQMAQLERQILTAATQSFQSSLEMKENVDFLLTPALLIQEVLSEEILITYPTE